MSSNIFIWPALRDERGIQVREHTRQHPEQSREIALRCYELMNGGKPRVFQFACGAYHELAGEQVARWLRERNWAAVHLPECGQLLWSYPEMTADLCAQVTALKR